MKLRSTTLSQDDTPEFFIKLRERAGRMGCDGLVITGLTNASTGGRHADNIKGSVATCIVFVDAEPVAAIPAK